MLPSVVTEELGIVIVLKSVTVRVLEFSGSVGASVEVCEEIVLMIGSEKSVVVCSVPSVPIVLRSDGAEVPKVLDEEGNSLESSGFLWATMLLFPGCGLTGPWLTSTSGSEVDWALDRGRVVGAGDSVPGDGEPVVGVGVDSCTANVDPDAVVATEGVEVENSCTSLVIEEESGTALVVLPGTDVDCVIVFSVLERDMVDDLCTALVVLDGIVVDAVPVDFSLAPDCFVLLSEGGMVSERVVVAVTSGTDEGLVEPSFSPEVPEVDAECVIS